VSAAAFCIDRDRIRRWAEFSGDFNPIHFDESAARALGAPTVVAHGMIGVTVVFQRLWDAVSNSTANGGWKLSAKLRKPILSGECVQVQIKEAERGSSFVVAGEDGTARITGALQTELREAGPHGQEEPPVLGLPQLTVPGYTLDPHSLAEQCQRLREALPECRSQWLLLSTCFFGSFLSRGIEPLRAAAFEAVDLPQGARVFAVQTSYAVTVLTAHEIDEEAREAAYACVFEPVVLCAIDDRCSARVDWTVSRRGRPLLKTSVGLFMKRTT
jgi:acyl dehydratase